MNKYCDGDSGIDILRYFSFCEHTLLNLKTFFTQPYLGKETVKESFIFPFLVNAAPSDECRIIKFGVLKNAAMFFRGNTVYIYLCMYVQNVVPCKYTHIHRHAGEGVRGEPAFLLLFTWGCRGSKSAFFFLKCNRLLLII